MAFLFLLLDSLGGYDKEEKAARAYDLAALKYWGPTTTTNFPVCGRKNIPLYIFVCLLHATLVSNSILFNSTFELIYICSIFFFPFEFSQISNYEKELEEMKNMTRQEFVASLRRSVIYIYFTFYF